MELSFETSIGTVYVRPYGTPVPGFNKGWVEVFLPDSDEGKVYALSSDNGKIAPFSDPVNYPIVKEVVLKAFLDEEFARDSLRTRLIWQVIGDFEIAEGKRKAYEAAKEAFKSSRAQAEAVGIIEDVNDELIKRQAALRAMREKKAGVTFL